MHTSLDAEALILAGQLDKTQPREQRVPCRSCGDPTSNLAAYCDVHWKNPARVMA